MRWSFESVLIEDGEGAVRVSVQVVVVWGQLAPGVPAARTPCEGYL